MYNGIIGLHSLLRWVLLALLVINILRTVLNNDKPFSKQDKSWNLRLLVVTHLSFLIGLYQYFFGGKGFSYFKEFSFGEVMKNKEMRFWAVEHLIGMLIAIVIITLSRRITKESALTDEAKHKKLMTYYIIALVVIIASIPWPFRFDGIPWFRPLY